MSNISEILKNELESLIPQLENKSTYTLINNNTMYIENRRILVNESRRWYFNSILHLIRSGDYSGAKSEINRLKQLIASNKQRFNRKKTKAIKKEIYLSSIDKKKDFKIDFGGAIALLYQRSKYIELDKTYTLHLMETGCTYGHKGFRGRSFEESGSIEQAFFFFNEDKQEYGIKIINNHFEMLDKSNLVFNGEYWHTKNAIEFEEILGFFQDNKIPHYNGLEYNYGYYIDYRDFEFNID